MASEPKRPRGRPRTKRGAGSHQVAGPRITEAQTRRLETFCAQHGTTPPKLVYAMLLPILGPE